MLRRRRNLDKCLVQADAVARRDAVLEQFLNEFIDRPIRIRAFVVQHGQGLLLSLQVVGSTPSSVLTSAEGNPRRGGVIASDQLWEDLFKLTRIVFAIDDPVQQFADEHEVIPDCGIDTVPLQQSGSGLTLGSLSVLSWSSDIHLSSEVSLAHEVHLEWCLLALVRVRRCHHSGRVVLPVCVHFMPRLNFMPTSNLSAIAPKSKLPDRVGEKLWGRNATES
mmetsp:Transcript_27191/g.71014  ORF Transcript_27191/g.71014 Transcript_27191/m.71014 type:complete len:221 (+) Transcript_27191:82-744(+)